MAETLSFFFRDGQLLLVPYTWEGAMAEHVRWLNDKTLMRFSEQRHLTHTMETQHAYLDGFPPEAFVWRIIDDAGGYEVHDVGTISAHIDPPNNVANMGILIGSPGHGYGLAAWRIVMGWLHRRGIRKIECGCMKSNTKMIRLAERAGMQKEAVVPGHFMLDGKPEDKVLFGIML